MQYRIRNGDQLISTVSNKQYQVTGLTPNTAYNLSVESFNGFRESPRASLTVKTRGILVIIPETLKAGNEITLIYQEYSLGSVPLGSEPTGLGGGDKLTVPAKVIKTVNNQSTVEITNSFNLVSDQQTMKRQIDGTFVLADGYKSLYYKAGDSSD